MLLSVMSVRTVSSSSSASRALAAYALMDRLSEEDETRDGNPGREQGDLEQVGGVQIDHCLFLGTVQFWNTLDTY